MSVKIMLSPVRARTWGLTGQVLILFAYFTEEKRKKRA